MRPGKIPPTDFVQRLGHVHSRVQLLKLPNLLGRDSVLGAVVEGYVANGIAVHLAFSQGRFSARGKRFTNVFVYDNDNVFDYD